MIPSNFLQCIVRPGLQLMSRTVANNRMASPSAELMMLAIALQESGLLHRKQQPGPARGFWQFERGGGFVGVMQHHATRDYLMGMVKELALPRDPDELWQALPESEMLQTVFARLLLWSDPADLPQPGDKDGAWDFYLRNWRPGKPHRGRWDVSYQAAYSASKSPGCACAPEAITTNPIALCEQIEALARRLRSELT